MRIFKITLLTLALLLAPTLVAAKQAPYPKTDAEMEAEYDRMTWHGPGARSMAMSSSTFQVPLGWLYLGGDDARRFLYLANAVEFPQTEGVAVNPETDEMVTFEYRDSGYVTMDDWEEMDADGLLKSITEGTAAGNADRKKQGVEVFTVVGWLQRPALDRETKTASWAIEFESPTGHFVNYTALKLGRKGYEEVTWVGDIERFDSASPVMTAMLDAHAYNQGFRYAEYVDGDKVAVFGVAALVAASAGGTDMGKKGMAAILAALAALAKKFAAVIAAGFAGLAAGLKRMLGHDDGRQRTEVAERPQNGDQNRPPAGPTA